jgi:hypothetical protein
VGAWVWRIEGPGRQIPNPLVGSQWTVTQLNREPRLCAEQDRHGDWNVDPIRPGDRAYSPAGSPFLAQPTTGGRLAADRPIVSHVTVTPHGERRPIDGVFQFRRPESAADFAVEMRDKGYDSEMRDKGYDSEITQGPLITETKKARSLNDDDTLADTRDHPPTSERPSTPRSRPCRSAR